MKTIQVYDPALCCSTGVCGVEVGQSLVGFAADFEWAKAEGALIEHFNLAQQPMAFTENTAVRSFLERSGAEALPLVLVDGGVAMSGRYPHRGALADWAGVVAPATSTAAASSVASKTCC